MKYSHNILVKNQAKQSISSVSASLPFTSIKFSEIILVNKSGEEVLFLCQFAIYLYKDSCNILVNKSGEKGTFFSASLAFTSMKNS